MSETLRAGIIGGGWIARVHAPAIDAAAGVELVAAADIDRARATAIHGSENLPGVYAEPWMRIIDEWLVEIARDVFEVAPFEVALVGEEIGVAGAEIFPPRDFDRLEGVLFPDRGGNLVWRPQRRSECP